MFRGSHRRCTLRLDQRAELSRVHHFRSANAIASKPSGLGAPMHSCFIRPQDVRSTSNSDRIDALQRTDAKCQKATFALQQIF
jgi:hypothetical protein